MVTVNRFRAEGPRELPPFVREASFPPELHREVVGGHRVYTDEAKVGQALRALSAHTGKYCTNNSMLCYVDGEGNPWCVPLYAFQNNTFNPMGPELEAHHQNKYGVRGRKIIDSLQAAGYEYGGVWVPHSNDTGAWGYEKARELARRESELIGKPGEVLPLKHEPPTPESIAAAWAGPIKTTETEILDAIKVEGAVEVPLDTLERPPEDISFQNPAVEDIQLRGMLGKQTNMVLVTDQDVGVTTNLRRQLEFYRGQLGPHLESAAPDAQAVEVVHTKACMPDGGFIEKFVLDREGAITKVTGSSTKMTVGSMNVRTVKLTPDDHIHIDMKSTPL